MHLTKPKTRTSTQNRNKSGIYKTYLQNVICRANKSELKAKISKTHTQHKEQWPSVSVCTTYLIQSTWIGNHQQDNDSTQTHWHNTNVNTVWAIIHIIILSAWTTFRRTKHRWAEPPIPIGHWHYTHITWQHKLINTFSAALLSQLSHPQHQPPAVLGMNYIRTHFIFWIIRLYLNCWLLIN